ncbi:MAG: glycosyltransferase family 4 protein [Phycisphaeraceae bacterium]|nr:glycosyltransferase family 4 protein [Phycisphaeraceae bacterium]
MSKPMHTAPASLKVAMIQDGARRAYALPIALHQAGKLQVMYTDWYDRPGHLERLIGQLVKPFKPAAASKLTARQHHDLNGARICSWPLKTLKHKLASRRFDSEANYYLYVADQEARLFAKHQYHHANLLLGCIRNIHPRLITQAKAQGLVTVGDQIIAPASSEITQAKLQTQRWPGWQDDVIEKNVRAFVDFEQQSWDNLDHILSMSDYVKQELIKQGVDEKRITLMPYPMDMSDYNPPDRSQRDFDKTPLTVGFVGAVNLRKGAPEFLETAKRFSKSQARFVMIGQNHINPDKLAPYQDHVQITGKIPRSQITQWLGQFDIFFFPTTCEGSAGSVIEAMAMGLPTVATFNAGSQIRDGIEGKIIPCGDMNGYYEALEDLIQNQGKRLAMGQAARNRAMQFNMTWYQDALISTLESFLP